MGFTVRCSGAAVWCFWRVEAETQSEGLGLGQGLGFVVAPSCGCMGWRRPPLSGLTRSCRVGSFTSELHGSTIRTRRAGCFEPCCALAQRAWGEAQVRHGAWPNRLYARRACAEPKNVCSMLAHKTGRCNLFLFDERVIVEQQASVHSGYTAKIWRSLTGMIGRSTVPVVECAYTRYPSIGWRWT
jgi:hypothetical protein